MTRENTKQTNAICGLITGKIETIGTGDARQVLGRNSAVSALLANAHNDAVRVRLERMRATKRHSDALDYFPTIKRLAGKLTEFVQGLPIFAIY